MTSMKSVSERLEIVLPRSCAAVRKDRQRAQNRRMVASAKRDKSFLLHRAWFDG